MKKYLEIDDSEADSEKYVAATRGREGSSFVGREMGYAESADRGKAEWGGWG